MHDRCVTDRWHKAGHHVKRITAHFFVLCEVGHINPVFANGPRSQALSAADHLALGILFLVKIRSVYNPFASNLHRQTAANTAKQLDYLKCSDFPVYFRICLACSTSLAI